MRLDGGAPDRAAPCPGAPVGLALPVAGPCLVQNSPARRVPSHGTDLFGSAYAIDLVPVDERGRSAPTRDWRALLATEPPERFVGFGRPVLAPAAGVVVGVHDGEPDHEARRSAPALAAYALTQGGRARAGAGALAGNHVTLALPDGAFVLLAHLRRGSPTAAPGDVVAPGDVLGACGNSGNSTEPHVHLQVMSDADATVARGLPFVFHAFRERRGGRTTTRHRALPAERAVVAPA